MYVYVYINIQRYTTLSKKFLLLQDTFVCLCLHKHTKVYYIKEILVLQNTFVWLCLHKHTKVYYIKDSFLLMQHTFVCLCLHKHTKVCTIAVYLCLNLSHSFVFRALAPMGLAPIKKKYVAFLKMYRVIFA